MGQQPSTAYRRFEDAEAVRTGGIGTMAEPTEISVEQALTSLVDTADTLPGTFSPEVGIWYYPGVVSNTKWACDVEADIVGTSFRVWGDSPQQAIQRAIQEAWRRASAGDQAEVEIDQEWYWRDAWLLASVFLAGAGSDADVADVIGATRRSSTPSVFMNREEMGWAVSRLAHSGLLHEANGVFQPTGRAAELWGSATRDRPTLQGAGFTRCLLLAMQPSEPASGDVAAWTISERDYLLAIKAHVQRTLTDAGDS
jgi:hypothetical protein